MNPADAVSTEPWPAVGTWRALARATLRRCPRCGQGKLFLRWLKMVERCPRCDLRFEREEGAFLGSLAINYGVTGAVAIGTVAVLIALTLPDPPVALLTLTAIGISIVVPLLFYPFAKTLWATIDLLSHRGKAG